jgi:small GTP-binding protein
MTSPPLPDARPGDLAAEAARRRTFAVISHPDAGKSTLTEALALHARVIKEAGHISGKAGRKSTVSDWMEMEKARGISITSAALQFEYRDCVVNLLDTPGHADFSEDTYRVLSAVDAAVMLLDAAKGLEPQTLKLFQVCRHRGIPILTVINKWDRPGKAALELLDEIEERIGITPTPLTWPVGIAGRTTPLLFAAAVLNFGVSQLLDVLTEIAPSPPAREDVGGGRRPVDAPFSAFVFKIQAGMDSNHRDRLAYARVCSGVFERGMVAVHAPTKKPFATKYAQQVFGRERSTLDVAYPGDVIGLVNASSLRVGDTLYVDQPVVYPPIPSFAPEHFAVCRAVDSSRYKQFRRGIEQLEQEGVVQVLRSDLRGDQAPVLAAVGPMQFEVVQHRMGAEFNAPVELSPLEYSMARRTDAASAPALDRESGVEVLTRASDGALLALVAGKWRLDRLVREHPDAVLEPLIAATD